MISIYAFSRKHLAEALYGEATPYALRRIDAYLDGEHRMTVDTLHVLYKMEPLLDLVKTLADMYARYELAKYRVRKRKKSKYGAKEQQGLRAEPGADPTEPCKQGVPGEE